MRILLDTHTALWMVNEHEKLPPTAKALFRNEDNTLFISIQWKEKENSRDYNAGDVYVDIDLPYINENSACIAVADDWEERIITTHAVLCVKQEGIPK